MKHDITKHLKRIQIILLLTVFILVFIGGCGDEDGNQQKEEIPLMSEEGNGTDDRVNSEGIPTMYSCHGVFG